MIFWSHDPEVAVCNMLANPDFNNEIDVAPYVELDANSTRRRSDFMSANYAWWQCVRFFIISVFKINTFLRISFMTKTCR